VEVRLIFRAPSKKFKILVIPNVLDHEKLYEYGFMKNMTIIKFAQSRASINFLHTIS
ncbi:hypothetical protein B296_00010120, partial [Ensete ventricosum]